MIYLRWLKLQHAYNMLDGFLYYRRIDLMSFESLNKTKINLLLISWLFVNTNLISPITYDDLQLWVNPNGLGFAMLG